MGPVSGGRVSERASERTRVEPKRENEGKSGRNVEVRGARRSTGRNKGDETVGVCNCSGFNALLMADGTRDWGNGLHQMSLLARGARAERVTEVRGKRETQERVFEETPRAPGTRGVHRRFLRRRFCVLVPFPIDRAPFDRHHAAVSFRLKRPIAKSPWFNLPVS